MELIDPLLARLDGLCISGGRSRSLLYQSCGRGGRRLCRLRRGSLDRPHDALVALLGDGGRLDEDASRKFAAEHFARPGADGPVDRALRLDSEAMLVDDPVERVDNMTMAFGTESAHPFLDHDLVELAAACPPALKLARDGKGVLKEAGAAGAAGPRSSTARRDLPVPALSHLEGPYASRARDPRAPASCSAATSLRPDRLTRYTPADPAAARARQPAAT